jgi:hypothetical protein
MNKITSFEIAWLDRCTKTGEVRVIERSRSVPGQTLEELRVSGEERIQTGGAITGFQISRPDGTVVSEHLPPPWLHRPVKRSSSGVIEP